jgi:fructokinase
MGQSPTVIGLGEILWDVFPSGRRLGGAPANFAYCSHLLGNRSIIASRIGADELGRELRQALQQTGVSDLSLQTDPSHPTGTVQVQLSSEGQPSFQIMENVAWDFLEWNESWEPLARTADAICFGTLAQRSPFSRSSILKFLDTAAPDALRVFDINLRQSFYSGDIVTSSLERASILKLNNEEVPVLSSMLNAGNGAESSFCQRLLDRFDLQLVCVTRGANGSLMVDRNGMHEHPGFPVEVADTVGAGDAFTAGLVHERLRGGTLAEINDSANRMGAWVASSPGAMPVAPEAGLEEQLTKLYGNRSL